VPKSEEAQTEQIKKLKEMLEQNETVAKQMRLLISDLERKTKNSKDKNRRN